MISLPKRTASIVLVAVGLSVVSLGLCLVKPALPARGIASNHELAHECREFRRQANLEVAEMASNSVSVTATRGQPDSFPLAIDTSVPLAHPQVRTSTNPVPLRRLILRPKVLSSRAAGGDDTLS